MSATSREIIIPANGIYYEQVQGSYFRCLVSTGEFFAQFGISGAKIPMNTGRGYGDGKTSWYYVLFSNTTGTAVTLTYYSGSEPFQGDTAVITAPTVTVGAAFANDIATCIAATPTQILKVTTVAAGATALSAVSIYFRKAILYGLKLQDGTINTDPVNIGASGVAGRQPIVINPGGEYVLEPPNGAKWNLQNFYLLVTTDNDGVVIIYT